MIVSILDQQPSELKDIQLTKENVKLVSDPHSDRIESSNGTLYIIKESVIYYSAEGNCGISIDYKTIAIHAISQDPSPHIYCQLDCALPTDNSNNSNNNDDDDDFAELRFFTDSSSVDEIFKALSYCSALHPDTEDEDGDGDDTIYDEGEYQDGPYNHHTVRHNGTDEDRNFDDAIVTTLEKYNHDEFFTSPDQVDQLTDMGKKILERLESVIVTNDMDSHENNKEPDDDDKERE